MALPERTARTYGPSVTAASQSVLLELMTVLRAYRDALILIGGWAPYFLLKEHQRSADPFVHVGSIDIDLAVDPERVREADYATIVELLTERHYRPLANRRGEPLPCSFERTVRTPTTAKPYTIRVDFLTHPSAAAPERQSRARVQEDLFARKVRGCEAAFRHHANVELSGVLPSGGRIKAPIRMADIIACLTMKGIVLGERYREKDAYDIYALLAHYEEGPLDVAELVRPHLSDPLVHSAMDEIRSAFAKRDANGPAWAAAFLVSPLFAGEYERLLTHVFMVASEFHTRLFASGQPGLSRNKALLPKTRRAEFHGQALGEWIGGDISL